MTTKAQQAEREAAIADLRDWLKPGETVYTVLRHVSASGMARDIDAYVIRNGEPYRITWSAAKAGGMSYNVKAEAIRMGGCGMDMGFALVYQLSWSLYRDGFGCIGEGHATRCPSSDHSNPGGRDYTPHAIQYTAETCPGRPCGADCDHKSGPGGDHWHKDGGYALRHRWL